MNILDVIKKWPEERKRFFSITLAFFLTVLIIILNSAIDVIWPENTRKQSIVDSREIKELGKSFSNILEQNEMVFEQLIGTSTSNVQEVDNTIDQDNSTSSSFGSTTNVVE